VNWFIACINLPSPHFGPLPPAISVLQPATASRHVGRSGGIDDGVQSKRWKCMPRGARIWQVRVMWSLRCLARPSPHLAIPHVRGTLSPKQAFLLLSFRNPRPRALASGLPAPRRALRGPGGSVAAAARGLREDEAPGSGAPEGGDADTTTRKFGLEAGLWKVFTAKGADGRSKGDQAKDLLKRYGSAYLITSISFALVSFAACYAMVNSGVDVGALLARLGLQAGDTGEKVGTFALAYAAHKALSPVRFPPTVALTPVVARWLGKDVGLAAGEGQDGGSGGE